MIKSALRQHFLAQRRALSVEDVAHRSRQIADRLFAEFFAETVAKTIHLFLPIARRNEVDTWPIIYRIRQHFPDSQVAVSVMGTTMRQLTHCVLTPETPLLENRWGIPEPEPGSCLAVDSKQIDVVLVPLLAFDRQGHRVGYGKGYYDRFLAECRPDCLKIGLSMTEPVERIDDVEPTDIRLNACVTPEQTCFF